jgi:predicted nucleic acid-binding protein
LIQNYAAGVNLLGPDTAFVEAEEYFPPIAAKRGLSAGQAIAAFERLGGLVQVLSRPDYGEHESRARARIAQRDVEDWPVIACALALDCPIWTEDRDFFGTGVATWTCDRVEIYLAGTLV